MSFLGFGKSKKNQSNALPAATRDITSSGGPDSRIPTANGFAGPRDGIERRGTLQSQVPAPASVNNSVNSLDASVVEPGKLMRARAESDLNGSRSNSMRGGGTPTGESPYPWSQRRLNLSGGSPFPRYGAAVNATASKEGWIYMMGGLVNSQMVKGDLWMVDVSNGNMSCFPVNTTAEGPGPRVGHASLLVGNAFIVFGGDTKMEDNDPLDDTLYLLNTATKQWSRASPAGPRPAGRYGHTLNILGSKIYIFGGQVEGYFFNDLVAFDLNSLQIAGNRWEVMIPNGGDGKSPVPAPRTNHSVVTWQDKLYLFGGTDGARWFNDVWTYDPRTNQWSELDCIGYIPAPREGHAAALVNDTMYIFGGRVQDGTDLGDLAAFRISSRRWYMFQNMGLSPSPRSGHSMTAVGKHIIVLAGEPSSAPRDATELSIAYLLDTSKIRYPPSEQINQQLQQSQNQQQPQAQPLGPPVRKFSNDRGNIQQKSGIPVAGSRGPEASGSRLPRNNQSSGPPPQQQAPQPRANGIGPSNSRSRTPTKSPAPPIDTSRSMPYDRENVSPISPHEPNGVYQPVQPVVEHPVRSTSATSASGPSRASSRVGRQQSLDSSGRGTPRPSQEVMRNDSIPQPSPTFSKVDELARELDAARSRNAWYAAELALARKAGYQPNASNNPILDQQAADMFDDDDRQLIEALLRMKAEVARVQASIDSQTAATSVRIAEIEKQRDTAIAEAAYAKAKLAAHGGGSREGTPLDMAGNATPDLDRANDMSRRLAGALFAQNELSVKMEHLAAELESEKRARLLAEDTADASQKRVSELEAYKQRTSSEIESLRAELHEAERLAREEAANSSQAVQSSRMLELDKTELDAKHSRLVDETKNHMQILQTLRDAVNASSGKAELLERKLDEERALRSTAEQKLAHLKAEHEERSAELDSALRRVQDSEEMAEKHAEEARTHRAAVLSGLGVATARTIDDSVSDERVAVLQQQVDDANALVRKTKDAADTAADKLRRAEERIAGLEAYQEQTSRENLNIRKQLQVAMREVQAAATDRAEMQGHLERNMLESNALEVQLKTLKNLLEERGVNPVDVRRSRVLESPGSRYGTPDLTRVRELERQLEESLKAHEDLRQNYEQREQEVSREWEEKLMALDNDHQGAVKYVRGLEKLLSKMKQELQRTKSANTELEKEIAQQKTDASAEWAAEREALRKEVAEMQESVKSSVSNFEAQVAALKANLQKSEAERANAQRDYESGMMQFAERARSELDALRHENAALEERARDAEKKVQLFLDQFESSVDNYRRQSRVDPHAAPANGIREGHASISGDSIFTTTTDAHDDDNASTGSGELTPSAHSFPTAGLAGGVGVSKGHERDRSSTALDSLATELETLRTHWETTNKTYRLSDKFDFEKSPTAISLGEKEEGTWRRKGEEKPRNDSAAGGAGTGDALKK